MLISMLLSLLNPFITKFILDYFIVNFAINDLIILFIIQVSIYFFKIVIEKIGTLHIDNKIEHKFYIYKRKLLSEFLLNKDSYSIKNEIEETINLSKIKQKLVFEYKIFSEIVINLILFLFSFFLMYKINLFLTCCIMVITFLFLILNIYKYGVLEKTQNNLEKDMVKEMLITNNFWKLKNTTLIKPFHKYIINEFDDLNQNIQSKTHFYSFKTIFIDIWSEFTEKLAPFLVLVFSIFLLWTNNFSLTQIILFLTLIHFFQSPISKIPYFLSQFRIYKKSLEHFLLWEKILQKWSLNKKENFDKSVNSILIQNADVYIDGKKILDIDFLKINSSLIIKGNNGVGKSTFCRLIAGTINYKHGTILLNGEYELNKYDISNSICLINTNEFLPLMKVRDFLAISGDSQWVEIVRKYDLHHILVFLGIDINKTIDSELGNFSTGQLKFLNLMRIMLKQYDWIILDEAFEGLDSRVRDFMILCIKDFQKKAKFIEISHSGFYVNKESRIINFEKINSQ
ncbi:hypothetical protein BLA55_02180 [Mycoplasmopsis pullorum]|uniref:ABC transmembrane type-1 domain-containing protein n=2 Tax=Mycoplasmopsis pullorum TaxID=48003 RepID=A0A1L4FS68_9BACT|nr:hypothetical protein BLA55_02180 [Mycoplasmopsis pullorum]